MLAKNALEKPSAKTIPDLLRERATGLPGRLAFSYSDVGLPPCSQLTYAECDRLARATAALVGRVTRPGQRVVLLFPSGLEFITAFFGCMYAGAVAVPCYMPQKRESDWARLARICDDCEAAAIVTTTSLMEYVASNLASTPRPSLPVLGTSLTLADDECGCDRFAPAPDQLAFLQYTSGSTGAPKGVMVSHANLLANLAAIHACFRHSMQSQGLIWLPAYHDMGLIGGMLAPLYGAFPVRFMSPLAFLQSPLRWLRAVADSRATTSGGPSFAYARVVKRVTPAMLDGLDLRSWKVAFNGAEPIDPHVLERFCELLAPTGFDPSAMLPCYGLAESTLLVSGFKHACGPTVHSVDPLRLLDGQFEAHEGHARSKLYVACGAASSADEVVIVNATTLLPCREGEIGEIWVRGPSVAKGYWGNPDASREAFAVFTADGRGPYLRTQDRGCLFRAELVITGRSSDMIVVHGKNVYAEDIEASARASHPRLGSSVCAAFASDELSDSIVLVQELERSFAKELGVGVVRDLIAQSVCTSTGVTPHAIHLVSPGSIPKTTSGKVQRRACRESYSSGKLVSLSVDAPQSK